MFSNLNFTKYPIALILGGLTFALGYTVQQADFGQLMTYYLLFFGLYLFVYTKTTEQSTLHFFIFIGILLRVILLFSLPNLSDDLYRFIWDGRLMINGYNPFDQLPSHYIEQGISIPGIDQALYDLLNSPGYFTVYPPVCQGVFAFASWLSPASISGAAIIMKLFFLAFEIGSIFLMVRLLKHFQLPEKQVLLYTLNPLIIIELIGNLHFEAAMIFFLLLSVWLMVNDRLSASAIAIGFSIASKLLPLMFLPLFIRRLGWATSIRYFFITGITLLVLFFPILNGVFLSNLGESLGFYFHQFEFNGSIYYLLRSLGFLLTGYNLIDGIGPALALIVFFSILGLAYKEKDLSTISLLEKMLFCLTLFLFCTTTVMPWYLSSIIALCVFTPLRFPILWSALIMLTYINYSYTPYHENLWIVALEYSLLAVLFWKEWKGWKNDTIAETDSSI